MQQLRLGVIGDLHTHWDDIDVAQLNGSAYDLLFFTGDLGGGTPQSSLRIARDLSRLTKPTLVMPGNNDTVDIDALAAELTHRTGMAKRSAMKQGESSAAGGQAQLCGYSVHATPVPELDLTLVAARPQGSKDLTNVQANPQADSAVLIRLDADGDVVGHRHLPRERRDSGRGHAVPGGELIRAGHGRRQRHA